MSPLEADDRGSAGAGAASGSVGEEASSGDPSMSALGADAGRDGLAPPAGAEAAAVLVPFSGSSACQDAERLIEDLLADSIAAEIAAYRDAGVVWLARDGGATDFPYDMGECLGSLCGAPRQEGGGASVWVSMTDDGVTVPSAFTTTNVQVAGVDEADIVKHDGARIFAVAGGRLHAVKSWPAEQTALRGSLAIDGRPRELFLHGPDRVVVFSEVLRDLPLSPAWVARALDAGTSSWTNAVRINVVDVRDLSAMRLVAAYEVPGHYRTARKVGANVQLVLDDELRRPPTLRSYVLDADPAALRADAGAYEAAYDALRVEAERLVRERSLADWMPPPRAIDETGRVKVLAEPCDVLARPALTGLAAGFASVVTLALDEPRLGRSVIFGHAGEVYASAESLYVTQARWLDWRQPGSTDATLLHKFDLTPPTGARYTASGWVEGSIVDQFALDEAASGHLRVVTTVSKLAVAALSDGGTRLQRETTSRVSVLAQLGRALTVVGRSEDLAPGERVMSSRILGDRGFVVTFRQVDPLFTFDLRDPAHPTVLGELKIPGFSTYLHPVGENHLVGMGLLDGAVQLALYDVSDLSRPRQTHTLLLEKGATSEALREHKAFTYFASRGLLAIPTATWSSGSISSTQRWSAFSSDVRVYSVDPSLGFTSKGALNLASLYQKYARGTWIDHSPWYSLTARRSIIIEDSLFALSDAGLRVAKLDALQTPLADVVFEAPSSP